MSKRNRLEDLEAHYLAGIGVAGVTLDLRIRILSLGYDPAAHHGFSIAPLAISPGSGFGDSYSHLQSIEDYITVCLAGAAGRYIRGVALRCHLKRSLGNTDLELAQLRQAWSASEPETERALIISLGHLHVADDGDMEASVLRLLRRAATLLKQRCQSDQLARLARQLLVAREMTGSEVLQFLRT